MRMFRQSCNIFILFIDVGRLRIYVSLCLRETVDFTNTNTQIQEAVKQNYDSVCDGPVVILNYKQYTMRNRLQIYSKTM